ncbi:hypothetical protein [Bacteroides heparinolyticus]|uniref:hypothetical protein n=1 Tax=Prevotella heparinolytica TaxID=28113 RepID=UPI00359F3213
MSVAYYVCCCILIVALATIIIVLIDRCIKLKIRDKELKYEEKENQARRDAMLNNHQSDKNWKSMTETLLKTNEEIIKKWIEHNPKRESPSQQDTSQTPTSHTNNNESSDN